MLSESRPGSTGGPGTPESWVGLAQKESYAKASSVLVFTRHEDGGADEAEVG